MNNNAGYQPAVQPIVVPVAVVPVTNRMRGPTYLQQGVRVGGVMLGFSCVICLGMFGIFFVFSATIMLATANYDDDFWDKFDRDSDPIVTVGSIFLAIGLGLIVACVGVCVYARKKYHKFGPQNNPGRVINPNPDGYVQQPQPAGYPAYPQPAGYPAYPQPAGYPGQPPPASYPGQPQPYGNPGQPQPYGNPGEPQPYGNPGQPQPPTGYPGQPPYYPEPTTSYPGPPAPYSDQPGAPAAQFDPSYPVKPGQGMTNEYATPPPNVPEAASAPYAPAIDPPPYKP